MEIETRQLVAYVLRVRNHRYARRSTGIIPSREQRDKLTTRLLELQQDTKQIREEHVNSKGANGKTNDGMWKDFAIDAR